MLRESEERFRLAVEAAPSGMIMTDGEGRIVMLNANAEKLFGYSRDELIGKNVDILLPHRFRDAHPQSRATYKHQPLVRAMGAGRDLHALRKDGAEIPVEIGLNPIETSGVTMAIASVVDISERKRAEAQRDLPPKRRGFGSLLLEQSLAQDLNGEVTTDFRPEGLVCTIEAVLGTGVRP